MPLFGPVPICTDYLHSSRLPRPPLVRLLPLTPDHETPLSDPSPFSIPDSPSLRPYFSYGFHLSTLSPHPPVQRPPVPVPPCCLVRRSISSPLCPIGFLSVRHSSPWNPPLQITFSSASEPVSFQIHLRVSSIIVFPFRFPARSFR